MSVYNMGLYCGLKKARNVKERWNEKRSCWNDEEKKNKLARGQYRGMAAHLHDWCIGVVFRVFVEANMKWSAVIVIRCFLENEAFC